MTLASRGLEVRDRSPAVVLDDISLQGLNYSDNPFVGLNTDTGHFGIRVGRQVGKVALCVQDPRNHRRTVKKFPLTDVIEGRDAGIILSGHVGVKPNDFYGVQIGESEVVYADPRANQVKYYPTGRGVEHDIVSVATAPVKYNFKHSSPSTDDLRIYEAHVKGFTARHPGIAQGLRGTIEGMAKFGPRYLSQLGMNAIELLPIPAFNRHNLFATERGLTDYWGYNPDSYTALQPAYAATRNHTDEFRNMCDAYHQEGISVILDVVYNHAGVYTPSGIDNTLEALDPDAFHHKAPHEVGFSGVGRSPKTSNPLVLNLVLDSMRHWIGLGADGFRFDLMSTLIRDAHGNVRTNHPFTDATQQDPILKNRVMIAEPWDLGPYGYQVGNIGRLPGWSEWNDRAEHGRRNFWKGMGNAWLSERFARGQDDEPAHDRSKKVFFLAAHDGMSLRDVVTYNERHNGPSKQGGHHGADNNRSWNSGSEGETNDKAVNELRLRRIMSMTLDLALTDGDIMVPAGDEMGHTKKGDNDTWSLDNEISWQDWSDRDPNAKVLRDFHTAVLNWRVQSGYFGEAAHTTRSVTGRRLGVRQEVSYNVWGGIMAKNEKGTQVIGQHLSDSEGRRNTYVCYKVGSHDDVTHITLPDKGKWEVIFNTAERTGMPPTRQIVSGIVDVPRLTAILLKKVA